MVAGGRRLESRASEKGGSETGPSPVDRARNGSKHHLLVDATGIPLAWRVTGGNRHVRRADLVGQSLAFDLTSARIVVRSFVPHRLLVSGVATAWLALAILGLAMIAILAAIPWPGRPYGRPLIRW